MARKKVREEWRAVPGYEGKYEISSHGRARSLDRKCSAGRSIKGVHLTPITDRHGYTLYNLCMAGRGSVKRWRAHHLVALAFIGDPPGEIGGSRGKWNVNHIDGERSNNVVTNLEWMLHGDNIREGYANGAAEKRHRTMKKNGTKYRGGGEKASKLTEDDVREIRRLAATGDMTLTAIGKRFGVTQPNVSVIVSRKAWKHVV